MKAAAIVFFSSLILLSACRKDAFITSPDAIVRITIDTLKFDTVFVESGSVTKSFKIVNENDKRLRLSSVRLAGGNSSAFSMNVDGAFATEVNNIEIDANDSLYVFVRVSVDPGAASLPFVIRDSITVSYNGTDQKVRLEAWGQNAHFLRDAELSADETWANDLPYVIVGSLRVNEGAQLTIEKGCRVYVNAGAPIIVNGTLVVNGEKDSVDRVYFMGDRLDVPYRDYPAAWPGIYFGETSSDNVMNYAVIKNAYQAIGLTGPSVNSNPKLELNECIIDNSFDAGIIAINSSIKANNCLISNCGKNLVLVGGEYAFEHCTVVSISNLFIQHTAPVLQLANTNGITALPLIARFRNCIFWGENGLVESEISTLRDNSVSFIGEFENVLWKIVTVPDGVTTIGPAPINNENPQFDSIDVAHKYFDFRLKETSPAIDMGATGSLTIDLDGNPRPVNLPDLGSYERQP